MLSITSFVVCIMALGACNAGTVNDLALGIDVNIAKLTQFEAAEMTVELTNAGKIESPYDPDLFDGTCGTLLVRKPNGETITMSRVVPKKSRMNVHRVSYPLLGAGDSKEWSVVLAWDANAMEPVFQEVGRYDVWAEYRFQDSAIVSNVIAMEITPTNVDVAELMVEVDPLLVVGLYYPSTISLGDKGNKQRTWLQALATNERLTIIREYAQLALGFVAIRQAQRAITLEQGGLRALDVNVVKAELKDARSRLATLETVASRLPQRSESALDLLNNIERVVEARDKLPLPDPR